MTKLIDRVGERQPAFEQSAAPTHRIRPVEKRIGCSNYVHCHAQAEFTVELPCVNQGRPTMSRRNLCRDHLVKFCRKYGLEIPAGGAAVAQNGGQH
jgi:hypothetical protein